MRIYDGEYKREQIDAAIRLKDDIIPHLIGILEKVLAEPKKFAEDENLNDQIYAVMLLGHFKESKAHRVIVDLFSLPDDLTYQIFGDLTTSDLPVILLRTCGGSVDSIKSLILNKEGDDYCRVSACQALAYAVIEGYDSRESVIGFFGTLFTGKEADEISDFWGLLANIVCDLYPEEIMDVIKQAYVDELILPGMIQYSYFKKEESSLNVGEPQMGSDIKKEKCEVCGENIPSYGTIYISSKKRFLCTCLKCYNKKIAEYSGTDFEHVEFEPIILKDTEGVDHEFHFTVRHLGDRIGIDSFEIKEGHSGGYEFSLIGDIEDEIFMLFGKLFERIRRGLSRKHIEWDNITDSWQISEKDVIRAAISSDLEHNENYGHPPLIVIDGKEITWEDFGRMLKAYEGFNFKLELFDRSDEMP